MFDFLPDDMVFEGKDDVRKTHTAVEFFGSLLDDIDNALKENLDPETVQLAIREGKAEVLCEITVEDIVVGHQGKELPLKAFIVPVDVELSDCHDTMYATYGDALVSRLSFTGYDIAMVEVADGSPKVAVIEMPKHLRKDDAGTSKT